MNESGTLESPASPPPVMAETNNDDASLFIEKPWSAEVNGYVQSFMRWNLAYELAMLRLKQPRPWWETLPYKYPAPPTTLPESELELREWRHWWCQLRESKRNFDAWERSLDNPPFWATETREECDKRTSEMCAGLKQLRREQYERRRRYLAVSHDLMRAECDKAHKEFMDSCPWYKAQYCGCTSLSACVQCWDIRPQW